MLVAALSLVAALHNPASVGQRIYAASCATVAAIGAGVAGRQVWLQNLPEDQVPACGPGLEYMLEVFPLFEVLEMALRGTGDCAEVQWTFLTISIPGWSLLAFCGFIVAYAWILFTCNNKQAATNI